MNGEVVMVLPLMAVMIAICLSLPVAPPSLWTKFGSSSWVMSMNDAGGSPPALASVSSVEPCVAASAPWNNRGPAGRRPMARGSPPQPAR